jgi:hypothetical protein
MIIVVFVCLKEILLVFRVVMVTGKTMKHSLLWMNVAFVVALAY